MHARRLLGATAVLGALLAGCGGDERPAPVDLTRVPGVLWRADAERPLVDEWGSLSTAAQTTGPGCARPADEGGAETRVFRETGDVAQGAFALHVEVRDGDRCFNGERAEVGQGNPGRPAFDRLQFTEGEDAWISWQMKLEPGFPVDTDRWQVLLQWKQLGGLGTPVLSFQCAGGRFLLLQSTGQGDTDDAITVWDGPAVVGRWVRFSLHVRFSADPQRGLVELWGAGAGEDTRRLLAPVRTFTLKRDPATGEPVRSHQRAGIYRAEDIDGTATLLLDGLTVARTRAAAETVAFAPPS